MKELSLTKMEELHGGNGDCLLAIGWGTLGVWGVGIGIALPVVGAALVVTTLAATALGYGGDASACG